MYSHGIGNLANWRGALGWLLLGFNSGFINAGGFIITGRFVTHVTGFATLFGVDFVRHGWNEALGILSVPIFFLAGAFTSGWLIDRRIFKGQAPRYDWVMGLSSAALFVATFASFVTRLVPFGDALSVKQVYVVLASLCLASGLQNAALTSSSGSSVRTTHLTGVVTDLGIGLATLLSLPSAHERALSERRANRLRAATIASFTMGSIIGAGIFFRSQYVGFMIPAAISAIAAWRGRKITRKAHRNSEALLP